ncbi:MAG: PaREP1 family protein [Chloroflexota bacterium]|nr:PaREP1 family protein [Chloroflexota bacterium]MDE2961080.1 PaREP1 family protein [Chloroflexota bacterium]
MTTQQYQRTSEHFLAQARGVLAKGDLPQASGKGWGAVVQILKAVAEQRGWEHTRHHHHLVTTSRLRSETGDADIRRFFNSASALHENFYENTMEAFEVAEGLDDVEALMDKLLPLRNQT